ncbi:CGNR zinc finger domain-containing protein [soil metagenome]
MNGHDWRHLEHVLGTLTTLINSAPPAADEEELGDVDALRKFVSARLITEVEEPTARDIEPMHQMRAGLRAVFVAPDDAAKTDLVNGLLASARIVPRLSDHDGLGLHLHYFPPFATIEEHLVADGGMALAALLTSGEGDRLKVCRAPDCSRVMVDSSRNRSRNFCDSGRCGNRVNAAAYRERQRVTPAS